MDFPSVLRVALRTLGRNKLRTALTLLGITIGIGAVICTVAIGQGGSNQIREQLLMLGDNFVWTEAGGGNGKGVRPGTGATKTLPLADIRATRQTNPPVQRCSPPGEPRTQDAYRTPTWNTTI